VRAWKLPAGELRPGSNTQQTGAQPTSLLQTGLSARPAMLQRWLHPRSTDCPVTRTMKKEFSGDLPGGRTCVRGDGLFDIRDLARPAYREEGIGSHTSRGWPAVRRAS